MAKAHIRIRPGVRLGYIRPELYGHFVEHIGRCVYEGMWVGENSDIPNTDGIRTDTIEALARTNPPVVRWPGGCFADNYHWRDGVGPRSDRPRRPNIWWKQEDTNAFGTHEFMETSRRLGTDPYICLNVGSGSPQEALEWIEYCNYTGNSNMSRLRAENGDADPWKVKWWAVGNENWGCGGGYTARDYAKEYRRYVTYLHQFDPDLEFIVCGHNTRDWNPELLEELRDSLDRVDHLSIHRYVNFGRGKEFSRNEYFAMMGRGVDVMDEDIRAAAGAIKAYTRDSRFIGVVLDEWGVWHPEATIQTGHLQPNTLRDGLFAASSLHMFHRHTDVLTMTNIAQTINILQCLIVTDGPKMALTPTYYAYDMLKYHQGADALDVETDSPSFEYEWDRRKSAGKVLDVAASASPDGVVTLTVVNRDPDNAVETSVALGADMSVLEATCLTGPDVASENLPGAAPEVTCAAFDLVAKDGEFTHAFEPRSITAIRLQPA